MRTGTGAGRGVPCTSHGVYVADYFWEIAANEMFVARGVEGVSGGGNAEPAWKAPAPGVFPATPRIS